MKHEPDAVGADNAVRYSISYHMPKKPVSPVPKRNLAYTIALDIKDSPAQRMMAKMLASSLLRTYFNGDLVFFRNNDKPIFQVERAGLTEVQIETKDFWWVEEQENAWRYKFRVRHLIDANQYDKVIFLDADCLALRNLDHLKQFVANIRADWGNAEVELNFGLID